MKTELRHSAGQVRFWSRVPEHSVFFFLIDVFVNMKISRGRKRIRFWHLRLAVDQTWHPYFMEVPHRIHKRPPTVPILSHIKPFYVFPPHFLKIDFSTVIPSMPRSSKFFLPSNLSTKTVWVSLVSHTCHMPLPLSFSSMWSPTQHLVDLGQRTVPIGRDIIAKIDIDISANVTTPCSGAEEGSPPINAMHGDVPTFFLFQNVVTTF